MLVEVFKNLYIGDVNLLKKGNLLEENDIKVIFTSNYLFNFPDNFEYHNYEICEDILANNNFYNIGVINHLSLIAKKIQKEINVNKKKVYVEFLSSNILSVVLAFLIINNKISYYEARILLEMELDKKLLLDKILVFQLKYIDYLYNENEYPCNYLLEYNGIYYSDYDILLNYDNLKDYKKIYLFTHLDVKIFGFPDEINNLITPILLDSLSLFELISRAKNLEYSRNILIITPDRISTDYLIQDYNFKFGIQNIKDYADGCSKMEIYYYQTGITSRKYQIFLMNHEPFPGITPIEYLTNKYQIIQKEITRISNNEIPDPLDIYKLELSKSLESLSKFNSNIKELNTLYRKINHTLNNLLEI
jgi:hypothetical protein